MLEASAHIDLSVNVIGLIDLRDVERVYLLLY